MTNPTEDIDRAIATLSLILQADHNQDALHELGLIAHAMGDMREENERLRDERDRLKAFTNTLAHANPNMAELLFRERKLNATLLDIKEERDGLREDIAEGNRCLALANKTNALLRGDIERLKGIKKDLYAENERLREESESRLMHIIHPAKIDCVPASAVEALRPIMEREGER